MSNILDDVKPIKIGERIIRSKEQVRLFKDVVVNSTTDMYESEPLNVEAFREFLLYLNIDSTLAPTTLRVLVQWANKVTGKWHTFKQGLFASLFWEDADTASGVNECFKGQCDGRIFRVKLLGVGVTATAYFTVSASVEFRD